MNFEEFLAKDDSTSEELQNDNDLPNNNIKDGNEINRDDIKMFNNHTLTTKKHNINNQRKNELYQLEELTSTPEINFLDLIIPYKPYEYRLKRFKQKKVAVERLLYENDQQNKFNSTMQFSTIEREVIPPVSRSIGMKRYIRQKKFEKEMCEIYGVTKNEDVDYEDVFVFPAFDCGEWEKQIDVNENISSRVCNRNFNSEFNLRERENPTSHQNFMTNTILRNEIKEKVMKNEFVEEIMNEDTWEDQIFFDETSIPKIKTHLILPIRDPNLIFEHYECKKPKNNRKKEIFNGEKPIKGRFNLSNDKYYFDEVIIKTDLGTLGVQHAPPALNLHPLIFKTYLTKDELRNFHRPKIYFPEKQKIFLSSPEHKANPNLFKELEDLSLRDECEFTLFEYSEELPSLLSNTGMVSLLTTFYRKTTVKDNPSVDARGQLTVLEADDPSPFLGFGDVEAGHSIDALTNNLFKAPVFCHSVDLFLCVFVKTTDSYRGYLRKIDNVYCVGQTFPLEEVYSPHSRKFNIFCKNRLKIEAYKLFKRNSRIKNSSRDNRLKNENKQFLKINELDDLFPNFSEGSKRKWLKEYSDYLKMGKENVWVLKETASILSDEDLRKLVTPENVCQYESMIAAEQRLRDSGYDLEKIENEDGEFELAPWHMTRNFVNATNGHGILELTGKGDPTGIGEGFSFIRVRQKKGDEIRKFTNEAIAQYKEEIINIWNRQKESLSSTKEIPNPYPDESQKDQQTVIKLETGGFVKRETSDQDNKSTGRFIIIRRQYDRNGVIETEEEKITDSRVIELYLKSRVQLKNEEKRDFLRCGSCGKSGHMKTNKACANFESIPRSTKKRVENQKKHAQGFLTELILDTIKSISSLNYASAFLRPVSLKKFPEYPEIIKNPIDLGTIRNKARQFKYLKYENFMDDLYLMKNNCALFNGYDHSLTKVANEMVFFAENVFNERRDEILNAENLISN
ncbi:putative transcription initiation factor [Dictyocoela muelleri]|nr:putative transcription initiation factor [Dictyocoela muelleri]